MLDEARLAELFVDYLQTHSDVLMILARRLVHSALTAQRRAERRVIDRDSERDEIRAVAKRVKIAIVLDMLCPNGLRLRFCSGREVRGFGDAFTRIAVRVGDDQLVGECLLESDARALLEAAA